jgi:hypothetical protein
MRSGCDCESSEQEINESKDVRVSQKSVTKRLSNSKLTCTWTSYFTSVCSHRIFSREDISCEISPLRLGSPTRVGDWPWFMTANCFRVVLFDKKSWIDSTSPTFKVVLAERADLGMCLRYVLRWKLDVQATRRRSELVWVYFALWLILKILNWILPIFALPML